MVISGLQKTTVIDYPGKVAAIVFTRGCNFRCPFCHNPELVIPEQYREEVPEREILGFLEKRRGVLDALVITGGEPLLHADIGDFIKKVRGMGYAVKLDTNGTNPDLLEELLDRKLVDYVATDVKNAPEKYEETVNARVNIDDVKKSIKIIMAKAPDYEFRTTVLPRLHKEEDFRAMGEMILGAKRYYIQNFRPRQTLDPSFEKESSYTAKELAVFKKIMEPYVENCEIRGII